MDFLMWRCLRRLVCRMAVQTVLLFAVRIGAAPVFWMMTCNIMDI